MFTLKMNIHNCLFPIQSDIVQMAPGMSSDPQLFIIWIITIFLGQEFHLFTGMPPLLTINISRDEILAQNYLNCWTILLWNE